MDNSYETLLKGLNKNQLEAVEAIEGPVMVVAGPGTGKTRILTLRIATILKKTQVNPENILALTFSESAALEMRNRLKEIIGSASFRVEIATFHSFCNDIIKNYPEAFPNLLSFENITEVEQIEMLEKIILKSHLSLLRPYGDPLYYLRESLAKINDLKKEGVLPKMLSDAIKIMKKDFDKTSDLYHEKGKYKGEMKGKYQKQKRQIEKLEEFLIIYKEYEKGLETEKKYDFNDMLVGVVAQLKKNKSLLLEIQEQYQYVLVDEHQDTNASQNTLLELLVSFYDNPNLFVVGDEKQAIYRFQGASLENFLYFKKLYPKAQLINLTQNYRSHQTILDGATSMILNNVSANILSQNSGLLANSSAMSEKIHVVEVPQYFDEYNYIVYSINEKIKNGTSPSEITILGRRNADLTDMAKVLTRKKIPFVMDIDQNILSDIHIQKLLLLFKTINDFGNDALLARTLHIDFLRIDPLDIYKLLTISRKNKKTLYDTFIKNDEIDLVSRDNVNDFYKKITRWKIESENIPFENLFIKIIDESGLRNYIVSLPNKYEVLEKLISLYEEIKRKVGKNNTYSLFDFISHIETLQKHEVRLKASTHITKQDGVRLLTVHKSKGLEFDYVYIMNCFDGRWGSTRRKASSIELPWEYLGEMRKSVVEFADIEDERRLFYVGMTRARRGIYVTYAKEGIDGKEQMVSQFITEIDEKFIEHTDISPLLKTLENEKEEILTTVSKPTDDMSSKKYIRELFLEKGLSSSGFENYLICPWKFFYQNLILLPDIKTKYMVFGTAVHAALEKCVKNRKKISLEFLLGAFEDALQAETLSENEKKELLEKGTLALAPYYENVMTNWPQKIESEVTIRGVKLTDTLTLIGRIDMIEYLDQNTIRVYDFKTGKPKSRSQIDGSKEDGNYNYLRQLVFYSILLKHYKDGKLHMNEGVVDFVIPDEKGKFHRELFTITKEVTNTLEEQIKKVGDEILSFSFWDKKCADASCEFCRLRSFMTT